MQEVAYRETTEELSRPAGAYELIRGLDKNVRDISSELYVLRRENERRFASLETDISILKKDTAELKHDTATLKNNVAELKDEVKELRRDVNEIKGDLKAITASLGATQNRFNWGLIIIGLFVALIQLLK